MVCSEAFVLIYIMNTLSVITGFFAVNNFKPYGQKNGLTNENYLAWLGSIAAVCNSIRFVWSLMTDYLPYKTVYAILLCIQIVAAFTIPLVSDDAFLFAIWISVMLLCEGGHFTIVPNVLKKIYGEKGTTLYGIMFSYSGISSILLIISQTEFLTSSARSYDIFFYTCGGASVVSLAILLLFFKEEKFVH